MFQMSRRNWYVALRAIIYLIALLGAIWIAIRFNDIAQQRGGGPLAVLDQYQVEAGTQLYADACASCHGESLRARGDQVDLRNSTDRTLFREYIWGSHPPTENFIRGLSAQEIENIFWYIQYSVARQGDIAD